MTLSPGLPTAIPQCLHDFYTLLSALQGSGALAGVESGSAYAVVADVVAGKAALNREITLSCSKKTTLLLSVNYP